MRALIIDDHPLIQEIVPTVLAKALGQVSVTTEATLEGGLEKAAAIEQPDLVLLDLGLPGCQGLDALSRFRKKFPQVPVVVLSATADRRLILAALEAGVRGYITKTAKPDVMIAALRLIAAGGIYVPPEALEEPMEQARRRAGGRRGSSTSPSASATSCASCSRATTTSASPPSSRSRRTRSSSTRMPSSRRSASRRAPRR